MAVKYKQYLQKMLDENKETFDEFRKLHLDYSLDQEKMQGEFNEKGAKIIEIVQEYENRLCADTERGMYIKYSTGLAEKFQEEVRKHFPLIDHIGLLTETNQKPKTKEQDFSLKKIKLA